MEYISTNSCIYHKHCHKEHCVSALKSVDKTCPDNALHRYFKAGKIGHMEGLRLFKQLLNDYGISSYSIDSAFRARYDRATDSYLHNGKPITSSSPHLEEMTAEMLIVLLCDFLNPVIIRRYKDTAMARRVLSQFKLKEVEGPGRIPITGEPVTKPIDVPIELSRDWKSEDPSDGV